MKKTALISTHTSLYKLGIWPILAKNKLLNVDIYSATKAKWGIKTFDNEYAKRQGIRLFEIKNYYLVDKLLFFQSIPFFKILFKSNYNTLILPGEVTCLSTWFLLFFSKLTGQKTIIWTHGMYGRETALRKSLKKYFYKLANNLFVYGNHSRNLLLEMGFNSEKVHVVFNSLDYNRQKELRNNIESELDFSYLKNEFFGNNHPVILFIGRITPRKRLDLLIQAAAESKLKGHNYNYLIIGEANGDYLVRNQLIISEKGLVKNFKFLGGIYKESDLSKYFSLIDMLVIPGKVGLSSMHSLAFGKPVISHSDFKNQVPEVESIVEGETGFLFEKDNAIDLSDKITTLIKDLEFKKEYYHKNCIRMIEERYSPAIQNEIITKAILNI